MESSLRQRPNPTARRRAVRHAPVFVLTVALTAALGVLCAAGAPPKPAPAPLVSVAGPGARARPLEPREAGYLERALAQIRRMRGNKGWIGSQPMGAGALAAAALSARGGPEAAELRAETARYVTAALDACRDRWGRNECARAELPLQRVVLQYPESLPSDLLARLRSEVGQGLKPPGAGLIARPWSFPDTENQRMIATARSLVAEVVAGRAEGEGAQSWGRFAAAFLSAHERDGWYEAESPGYLILSITSLLQLADFAPQPQVRELARRQLDVLFATWALRQVGGFPAGAKSRTYSFWALSDRGSAWKAWHWLLAGSGDPETINFMDRPELPVSLYRVPQPVIELLRGRRSLPPYEIRERRKIVPEKRRKIDVALYTWATPDYVLGVAQTFSGHALRVSGGQEIVATLFAEGEGFAPLYLWSRTRDPHDDEDADWTTNDQAAGYRNAVVAKLGTEGVDLGHAYLSPPWSKPEPLNEAVLVARRGETYVALVAQGGWEVAPATERFPKYYGRGKQGARDRAGSWVAVPRRQPAAIGLLVGRAREDGDFGAWRKKVASARLTGAAGEIRLAAAGVDLRFEPGKRATASGKALEESGETVASPAGQRFSSPNLWRTEKGDWKLELQGTTLSLAAPGGG